ncbi:MAG: BCAM0308 family protein [Armatimonadetes bacterium]|nr:BCAM0308 family protein [Armatimonadota bacterium]
MSNKHQHSPHTIKEPVHIRRNVAEFSDPYIDEENLPEGSVCKRCGAINSSGRWYPPDYQNPRSKEEHSSSTDTTRKAGSPSPTANANTEVVCPACRKLRDHAPGGILKLTGGFVWEHKDEILNLIRNESNKALNVNPLERIMSLRAENGEIEITTTNEKLAQRIGKAIYKAYSGSIEYKWSEDNKLVRVAWHRDL